MGSIDAPFNPLRIAIAANASFIARAVDRDLKHLSQMIKRAHAHHGTALVEIYQDCIVYNKGAFSLMTDKATKEDQVIYLEHGQPMIFGKGRDKGIRLDGLQPQVVSLTDGSYGTADLLVHDETNHTMASLLVSMSPPALPMALGVLYCDPATSYEAAVYGQIKESGGDSDTKPDFNAVLRQGHTWTIEG